MSEEPKTRLNLVAAMNRGKRQGGLRFGQTPVTDIMGSSHLRDARDAMSEAEAKFTDGAPLWVREWVATAARGILKTGLEAGDTDLVGRAKSLQARLHTADEAEIGPIRDRLIAGELGPKAFRAELLSWPVHERDAFVRRLLSVDHVPQRRTERPAGMVHYVVSSLEAVLALADLLEPEDVFYDIGSGLGFVTMLLSWLTEARIVGVEYEPAYHERAQALAGQLGFTNIEYIQGDARHLDYDQGTIFYFYDSMRGTLLDELLLKFEQVALRRTIRVVSRGHSIKPLRAVPWLRAIVQGPEELVIFESTHTP